MRRSTVRFGIFLTTVFVCLMIAWSSGVFAQTCPTQSSFPIPAWPREIPIDHSKFPPRPYDPLNFSPRPIEAVQVPMQSGQQQITMMAETINRKYAEGKKVLVLVQSDLSAAIKPMVDKLNLIYQEKVGASVVYYELNWLVDGSHRELRSFIVSQVKADPAIDKVLILTTKDVIPRFEIWEQWPGYPEPELHNFPMWILYYWDLDTEFIDSDGNGILDTRQGGTTKLEIPVLIYQPSFTPAVGSPVSILIRHLQNYLDYADGRMPLDLQSAMIYDELAGNEGSFVEPHFRSAVGDNMVTYFDTVWPYDLATGPWYIDEQMAIDRLVEEVYCHGNAVGISFAQRDENDVEYFIGVYTWDFLAGKPNKKFMVLRSCGIMDCQVYEDCVGHTISNSGNVLGIVGNGKIGNLSGVWYLYDYMTQSLAMEDAVLAWLNKLIENDVALENVTLWMGALVYVGMPYAFPAQQFPVMEQITFRTVDSQGNVINLSGQVDFTTRTDWTAVLQNGTGVSVNDFTRSSDTITVTPPVFGGYQFVQMVTSCSGVIFDNQSCNVDMVYQAVPDQVEKVSIWLYRLDEPQGLIPYNGSGELVLTDYYNGTVVTYPFTYAGGYAYLEQQLVTSPHLIGIEPPVVSGYDLNSRSDGCQVLYDGNVCGFFFYYTKKPEPPLSESLTVTIIDEASQTIPFSGDIRVFVGDPSFLIAVSSGSGTATGEFTATSGVLAVEPPAIDGYEFTSVEYSCNGLLANGSTCDITVCYRKNVIILMETVNLNVYDEAETHIAFTGWADVMIGGTPVSVYLLNGSGSITGDYTNSYSALSAVAPVISGYELKSVDDSCGGILTDGATCAISLVYRKVPPHDLSVGWLRHKVTKNRKGEVVRIEATCQHLFNGTVKVSGKYQVAYYAGDTLLSTKSYGNLRNGKPKEVKIRLPKDCEGKEVRAIIDPSNLIEETDENNNSAARLIQ